MFTDRVELDLRAGKGGNGVVAWARAKYIPKGGPCGGNGGKGGNVIIRSSPHLYALDRYRNLKTLKAEHGADGGASSRQGKSGKDRILEVPVGTMLKDLTTDITLYDFIESDDTFVICHGGKGGKGNESFKSPTNQAPNTATSGLPGEEKHIELDLKLLADVGFVGMPNAGKSTLLSALTMQKVKIGDYPFTTLTPNLGYIQFDDFSRIHIADIPGLIEGAHRNRGLGYAFLKHIERCKVLVYLIDAAQTSPSPREAFTILSHELASYNPELMKKPSIIVLNKTDLSASREGIASFHRIPNHQLFCISARKKTGLPELITAIKETAQVDGKKYT